VAIARAGLLGGLNLSIGFSLGPVAISGPNKNSVVHKGMIADSQERLNCEVRQKSIRWGDECRTSSDCTIDGDPLKTDRDLIPVLNRIRNELGRFKPALFGNATAFGIKLALDPGVESQSKHFLVESRKPGFKLENIHNVFSIFYRIR
jgi:hypothetical protein